MIRTMIEEKGLMGREVEVDEEGLIHYIPVAVIVEYVENTPEIIKSKIKKDMTYIDFKNGNMMNYIEHLGKAMVFAQRQ